MTLQTRYTVCPHDCPSACALKLEVDEKGVLQKVKGDTEQSYTAGAICAKVGRYSERVYHPDRVLHPMLRTGAKGAGEFRRASWSEALDLVSEKFREAIDKHGAETVWPYNYGGTMGLLQRDILEAFRHAGGFSGQDGTICSRIGSVGWQAGAGAKLGTDGRDIAKTDLLVLWGTNAAATQINVLTHFAKARKNRNAKLVVIDPYLNDTARRADVFLPIKPGTDGALACAVMHVLLAEGLADKDYLQAYTDFDSDTEAHFANRDPAWAAAITGLSEQQIIDFARLYGNTERTFIRIGVGLSRSRNGASNIHAISGLPAITGAWTRPGSGALFMTSGLFSMDKKVINGLDEFSSDTRILDMCRIGAVLTGDTEALKNGPPVCAMIIQNTNPAVVAPDLGMVRKGLLREDLFLCVHEQFVTDTAKYADVILPATMSFEHDDMYSSYGHSFLQAGPQVLEVPGECRSNHQVLGDLAAKMGIRSKALELPSEELMDESLKAAGFDGYETLRRQRYIDLVDDEKRQPFADGFGWPDGRFRFKPDWRTLGPYGENMPVIADHWDVIDSTSQQYPFRLITPTAKGFLNTSFNNIEQWRKKAGGEPSLMMNPKDALDLKLEDGDILRVSSKTGSLKIVLRRCEEVPVGTVVAEGIWNGSDHIEGLGINVLISDEPCAPSGGAVFHDTAVSVTL